MTDDKGFGVEHVWRYQPLAMIAHDHYGGGSVMAWGGITVTGRSELHICRGNVSGLYYRDKVIEPIVVPCARRRGNAFVSQDDNVKAHCARAVQDHLQFRRTTTLPRPAKSPDLLMTNNTSGINTEMKVNGQRIEIVASFKYLDSVITDEGSKPEILSRIAQTTAALTRLKPL